MSYLRTMRIPAAALAIGLLASDAAAVPVVLTASGANGSYAASATDLMNQGEASLSSVALTSGSEIFGSSIMRINDGSVYNGGASNDAGNTLIVTNGSTFLVNFNTALNPFGYDIGSIVSIAGSGGSPDQDRAGQAYAVEASLVGSSSFFLLAAVNFPTTGSPESRVSITDSMGMLAIGVDVLRFTIFDDATSSAPQTMYREFDVMGSAAAQVPEPSSLLLLGGGSVAVAAALRRRVRR